ncbi:uncharacterized protein LACBIDRAFT_331758 [Laccaria bicolor S238N-H82]|uniref:Predicted protein n=1 Tax=Laccaria bicolor (strain S238N-H82 / ATCC MYA-4686) TaxID=486041 RepID=B0DQG6_LACBS|nr:uncharacterized protein LACBIDRAFT_331758 [Laccaria bicolor S238N-H82]EDR03106.1 predicted protein [Laccaria bicolor S238N-H82]|eukprot:XP_001886247.1 predicted protein [Laccaria bicolor S238N-H82]
MSKRGNYPYWSERIQRTWMHSIANPTPGFPGWISGWLHEANLRRRWTRHLGIYETRRLSPSTLPYKPGRTWRVSNFVFAAQSSTSLRITSTCRRSKSVISLPDYIIEKSHHTNLSQKICPSEKNYPQKVYNVSGYTGIRRTNRSEIVATSH